MSRSLIDALATAFEKFTGSEMRFEFVQYVPLPAAETARLVDSPAAFAYLTAPILRVTPVDPPTFGARFRPGPQRLAVRVLGLLPVGEQVIDASWPAPPAPAVHELLDTGGNGLTRRYAHSMRVEPAGPEGSRCIDRTEVDAGLLTPVVTLAFRIVNWIIQRRWARLARLATRRAPASGPPSR